MQMHVTCFAFLSSSAFSLAPFLLRMQYHSKRTLEYILVTLDLETVEVVCIL